jgi:hypothetical protein
MCGKEIDGAGTGVLHVSGMADAPITEFVGRTSGHSPACYDGNALTCGWPQAHPVKLPPMVINNPRAEKLCRETGCERKPLFGWVICEQHLESLMERAYRVR